MEVVSHFQVSVSSPMQQGKVRTSHALLSWEIMFFVELLIA